MNNDVIRVYNQRPGNIVNALRVYSTNPNKTKLFQDVLDLIQLINDSKDHLLATTNLPPADNIDTLIAEESEKRSEMIKQMGTPEEVDTRGFELVVYHYIYSVRLKVLEQIKNKGGNVKKVANLVRQNTRLVLNDKLLQNVITFGDSLEFVKDSAQLSHPKITINFELIRCSINNVDLLSILSTPEEYENVVDVLSSLRDRDANKTRELSYIGKNDEMKSDVKQLFAYQDCKGTSTHNNDELEYFPYGNLPEDNVFVKQFGLLSAENFNKYFLPWYVINIGLKQDILVPNTNIISWFRNLRQPLLVDIKVLCHPSDIRKIFGVTQLLNGTNIENLPFLGSIIVPVKFGVEDDKIVWTIGDPVAAPGAAPGAALATKSLAVNGNDFEIVLDPSLQDFAGNIRNYMQAAYLSNHNIQIFTGLDVMNKPKAQSILFANLIKAQSELNIELIYQILKKLHLAPANILTLLIILKITISQQELYYTYGTHKLYYKLVKQKYTDRENIKDFFNSIISFINDPLGVHGFNNRFDSTKNELLTFLSDDNQRLFNVQLEYYLKLYFSKRLNQEPQIPFANNTELKKSFIFSRSVYFCLTNL